MVGVEEGDADTENEEKIIQSTADFIMIYLVPYNRDFFTLLKKLKEKKNLNFSAFGRKLKPRSLRRD